MKITKDTKVGAILDEYGDIADVMEALGLKRVAGNRVRRFIAKFISVKVAAKVHKVPLDILLKKLETATASKS
jgi:hypothetical protein